MPYSLDILEDKFITNNVNKASHIMLYSLHIRQVLQCHEGMHLPALKNYGFVHVFTCPYTRYRPAISVVLFGYFPNGAPSHVLLALNSEVDIGYTLVLVSLFIRVVV